MVHLPGFKHEIFISYPRETRGWVREFHSHLRGALNVRTRSDQKPRVFFDDNDWGGQDSSKLLEAARNSALFIAVVSPAYVAHNKFTLKELEAFCNASRARGSNNPLIFIIEYLPIESEHRPALLHGPRRYQFWIDQNGVEVPLTIGSTIGEIPQVSEVAKHIRTRLDEPIMSVPDPPEKPTIITEFLGKVVLLGRVTDDLVGTRDELRASLQGLGIKVLPQSAYPEWGPEFREFFEGQLAQLGPSDLFIQLLTAVRSEKWRDEEESCAQFQHKAAHDASKRVFVWRPDWLDITQVHHHDLPLLESAQAMTLERLKTMIREELAKLIKDELKKSIEDSKPLDRPPLVYITASREDRECARWLQGLAVDLKGAAKIMHDKNPGKEFEETVSYADAVIFSYGNARRTFVDKWLVKYYRLSEHERSAPKQRIKALYRAPPRKESPADELNMDFHGLRKCGSHEEFNPECMKSIMKELIAGNAQCPKCGLIIMEVKGDRAG